MDNHHIGIIGLGWLGEPLAKYFMQKGYKVSGSTTSFEKLDRLSQLGCFVGRIELLADRIKGDWEAMIYGVDTLVVNFPPKRVADIENIYPAQVKQLISATSPDTNVIFVSSTAVYGNENRVMSEKDAAIPTKSSGLAVLQAEKALEQYFGERLTILRVAGLIGPKRHPGRFLANKKQLKQGEVPVNLIHLNDCIQMIDKVVSNNCYGQIINGCADEHPLRKDFYTKASRKLGLPAPEFTESPNADYKIISNQKSKDLLGMEYAYANPSKIFDDPYGEAT